MDRRYKNFGQIRRLGPSILYSWYGLRAAWKEEIAFRQEVCLFPILIALALWLPVAPAERVLLIGSWGLIIVVELLNTGLESVVDRLSMDKHELSKRAKDCGSAAVFVSIGLAIMTWALIAGPVLWARYAR